MIDHPDGPPERFPDTFIQGFQNPAFPDLRIEYKLNKIDPSPDTQGPELLGSGGNGSKFRTLHPTKLGHFAMADKIIKRLQTYYGTVGAPGPCPAGCDCSAGVPRCTWRPPWWLVYMSISWLYGRCYCGFLSKCRIGDARKPGDVCILWGVETALHNGLRFRVILSLFGSARCFSLRIEHCNMFSLRVFSCIIFNLTFMLAKSVL